MKYLSLYFSQGEGAEEMMSTLDTKGAEAVVDYLIGAGVESPPPTDWLDSEPWGGSDSTYDVEYGGAEYVVSVNWSMGYIGLTRVKGAA